MALSTKEKKSEPYLLGPAGEALRLGRALLVLRDVLIAVIGDEAGLRPIGKGGRIPLFLVF